jgi:protein SCO1/2
MSPLLAALGAVGLFLSLTACRSGATPGTGVAGGAGAVAETTTPAGVKVFMVRGVVREIRPGGREVVIRHETIPGYMAAMTMPFTVKDPEELAEVGPGDTVQFRLTVTEEDGWIDQVRVLQRAEPEDPRPVVPEVRVVRQVDELEVGDELPDYPLVTESRRRIRLNEFRGRALGLTFIYTRCPYPTFCPRQTRQFVEAAERLKARLPGPPARWHLLAISFDPAHDTPAVLRRYARQYGADLERLNFCTGEVIDLDAITEQFGMIVARDGEGFSHNVRTVVVGADGRIRRIFIGNEWTVDDFVAEMLKAAGAE